MSESSSSSLSAFLAPRYWPTWIGIGLLTLIAWLPHRVRLACGATLGWLIYLVAIERRYITGININLCFPELSHEERKKLVKRAFLASGTGLIETASGWMRSPAYFKSMVTFTNADVLLKAVEENKGVLLLGAHYSTLDLGANLLSQICPFAVTYRPHRNSLFDAFMFRGRKRNTNGTFDRYDIRGMFRHLKKGKVLWYAPDQDYGPEHAVYAPWFGNQAATITAPSRFASINNSPVVVVRQFRKPGNKGYELAFERIPDRFPSGDDVADATLVNTVLEKAIRYAPEQYLWMHKRFKSQPEGKPQSPYIDIHTPISKLKPEHLAGYMQQTNLVESLPQGEFSAYRCLDSGMYLRLLSGDIHKKPRWGFAHKIDKNSKALRRKKIETVTVERWFRLPGRKQCGMLCHLPGEESLGNNLRLKKEVSWTELGYFLWQCHKLGVNLNNVSLLELLVTKHGFGFAYPEQVNFHPFSLCILDRVDNLNHFINTIEKQFPTHSDDTKMMLQAYMDKCSGMIKRELGLKMNLKNQEKTS